MLAFQNSKNTGFTIHSSFYSQNTAIILMPSERHLFRIVYDYQSKNFDFSAHLFDIAYQFTLNIKRKIDWELKLNNIFNQKKIEEIGISHYSIYSNSFYLRPRQIFISIKTNIQK